jgi:hypothetical protein
LDKWQRARTGGEASSTENPEDGYKEDQSTSHAVTDHDIFLPRSGAICEGVFVSKLCALCVLVASKVAERMLTVCAEFQRERVEPPFLGRVS